MTTCPRCSVELDDHAKFCRHCGIGLNATAQDSTGAKPAGVNTQPSSPSRKARQDDDSDNIPDYMVWAIFSAFLFPPLGLAAVFYAWRTLTSKDRRDFDEMRRCNHFAVRCIIWGWLFFFVGILFVYVVQAYCMNIGGLPFPSSCF